MVTTSIIPNKPKKPQDMGLGLVEDKPEERSLPKEVPQPQAGLYDDLETGAFSRTLSSSLGLPLPNPAPEIDIGLKMTGAVESFFPGDKRPMGEADGGPSNPRKKKYAKEAWPGRKPGPTQGLF